MKVFLVLLCMISSATFCQAEDWRDMFDMKFTNFEKWLGTPHEDIKGQRGTGAGGGREAAGSLHVEAEQ